MAVKSKSGKRRRGKPQGKRTTPPPSPRELVLTHFHAARIEQAGDVVMAVTRRANAQTLAPIALEVRAFTAQAPQRTALPTMSADELLAVDGGLAHVAVALTPTTGEFGFDDAASRVARVTGWSVAGDDSAARAGHVTSGLADWLRATLEQELVHGLFVAVEGTAGAFGDGDLDAWASAWLGEHGYEFGAGGFRKVLNQAFAAPTADDVDADSEAETDDDE